MTARLAFGVAGDPVDRVEADIAIVGCVSDERPLRGAAARADWRLCGAISKLLADGSLVGTPGEAALFPSSGGVRAPRVLALGLGSRGRPAAERLRGFAEEALGRSLRLRVGRAALALLPPEYGEVRDQVEELVSGLLPCFADAPADTDLSLALLAPPEALRAARETLAQLSARRWPEGIAFVS